MVAAAQDQCAKPIHLFAQFTRRDLILYALGIGCCIEAQETLRHANVQSESTELKYVYENHTEFEPFPTFLLSLPFQSELLKDGDNRVKISTSRLGSGIRPFPPESLGDGSGCGIIPRVFFKDQSCVSTAKDLPVLHMTQKFTIHNRLVVEQITRDVDEPVHVWIESRVLSIDPRSIGTFVTSESRFYQESNGSKVCVATSEMTALVLGLDPDLVHNFGPKKRPDRETINMTIRSETKSKTYTYQIPQNSALLYRLSGDYNPIHVEGNSELLDAMGATSNNGPVLHGLCTLGYAVRAVLRHAGDLKSSIKPKLISVECNFVKPVFVGDSLKVVVWDHTELSLQAKKSLRLVFIIYRMSSNGKYVQIDKNDVDGKHELVVDRGVAVFSPDGTVDMNKNDMSNAAFVSRL